MTTNNQSTTEPWNREPDPCWSCGGEAEARDDIHVRCIDSKGINCEVMGHWFTRKTWNTRSRTSSVSATVDQQWFDLALRYLRGDPELTDIPYSDDSVFADFLRFWDQQTPHFRSVIKAVFQAAPQFAAASTVAPQEQSVQQAAKEIIQTLGISNT